MQGINHAAISAPDSEGILKLSMPLVKFGETTRRFAGETRKLANKNVTTINIKQPATVPKTARRIHFRLLIEWGNDVLKLKLNEEPPF